MMKLVRENINFERGLDPRIAMNLIRVKVKGDRGYGDYKVKLIRPYRGSDVANGEDAWEIEYENGLGGYAFKYPKSHILTKKGYWGEIDSFLGNNTNESINFERGIDPKKSMKIGRIALIHKFFDDLNISRRDYYIKNDFSIYFPWGGLDLSNTKTFLPDNLTINGSLDLSNSKITSLPNNLTVGSTLILCNTNITSLPDNLTVKGNLYLKNTKITSLPDNLTVKGNLYLKNTKITSLPNNLTVKGLIDLRGTKISKTPHNANIKGPIIMESANFERGLDPKHSMKIGTVQDIYEKWKALLNNSNIHYIIIGKIKDLYYICSSSMFGRNTLFDILQEGFKGYIDDSYLYIAGGNVRFDIAGGNVRFDNYKDDVSILIKPEFVDFFLYVYNNMFGRFGKVTDRSYK